MVPHRRCRIVQRIFANLDRWSGHRACMVERWGPSPRIVPEQARVWEIEQRSEH